VCQPDSALRASPVTQALYVMMEIQIEGVKYELVRGSDIDRDGMFLEASILDSNPLQQVAEVFYSDQSHEFTFSCFMENIPLELIEKLISSAKERLPSQ